MSKSAPHRLEPTGAVADWIGVDMDDLSAMGEAIAAMRSAPPEQRAPFWNAIRDLVDGEVHREAPEPRPASPRRTGLVYYVRFGDRVKIGYTTNLTERLRVLPHDELLATEPGTIQDERARHEEFAHLRVNGEWFDYDESLARHIAALAS